MKYELNQYWQMVCVGLMVVLSCLGTDVWSQERMKYCNPVWNMALPDPAVIKAADGYYYAYATQGIGPDSVMCNIQTLRSPDLVHWTHLGDALPAKPAWASETLNFWAPHVMRRENDGKYVMYYSAEPNPEMKKGKDLSLSIGVALSESPSGPFVDIGAPILEGDGFINIDPMAFRDPVSGRHYLYWGSGFEPLKVRELADDCLGFKDGSTTTELIKPATGYQFLVEGSWVIYRNGWYYLFYSGDNCCGERAHYAVMVARSKSPTGPYEVLFEEEEGDHAILEANERWLAPGHNSIITDDAGTDWIIYHAIDPADRWVYPKLEKEDKRVMMLDRIEYANGWPSVRKRSPSDGPEERPVINIGF